MWCGIIFQGKGGYVAFVGLAVRYITDVACLIRAGSCWKLL
jgi:hypothetical protein